MKIQVTTKLLLIFFTILFVSCTSSRRVSYKQAMAIHPDRNYLTVYNGKKKYTLVNYQFSDSGLTGTIIKYKPSKGFPIQVYANLDKFQELNKNLNKHIRIDSSSILEISVKKRDARKTGLSFLEFFAHIFTAFAQ